MTRVKARGSWASYRDEKDKTLWRCDLDEMATSIVNGGWGNVPISLSNKKAMEIFILAEAYLKYRDNDKMKTKRKVKVSK
jgi:hypothetical protein